MYIQIYGGYNTKIEEAFIYLQPHFLKWSVKPAMLPSTVKEIPCWK